MFFSRHIPHCKLPWSSLCSVLLGLHGSHEHQQPSTTKYTSPLGKATHTPGCWQSPVALSSTGCFYPVLNSSLCFPRCQTRPSFRPERRHQILCTASSSIVCAATVSTRSMPLPFLQPLHLLSDWTAVTRCLDCCNKMLLIKLLRKHRNVYLPVLEVGVYNWCPKDRQCLVRAALKVAIFSLWPHGVEDASSSQGSLL